MSAPPNKALERTGGNRAHHGRASLAAGRSTPGRSAAEGFGVDERPCNNAR